MSSFFMIEAAPLVRDSQTMKLHQLLDWAEIDRQLVGLYRREASNAGGPEPYAPLGMFKLMLLGQWHGLSDNELERALKVRVDFMVFTGFEPGEPGFPDATTICRFRNRLVKAKLDQRVLRKINGQLERAGLKVQGSTGALIDSTIIPSAARPNSHIEMDEDDQPQLVTSADPDATWVKKSGQAFYGYRGYASVDSEDGYVEHVEVHPANQSEMGKLPQIVNALPTKPRAVLADKGFASAANRQHLQDQGIGDLIQYRGHHHKPLHPLQTKLNQAIGAIRFKVEQAFGTMKRMFGLARARYMTTAKVQAQMIWAALGMNLLKAHRKLNSQPVRRMG
jgi:IS5 family transposase